MFVNMSQGYFRPYEKPSINIYINDKKLTDWIRFKVNWNGMGDVDSFEIELQWDVSDTPREELFFSGKKGSFFLVTGKAVVRIEGGFEGEEIRQWIEGDMDYRATRSA